MIKKEEQKEIFKAVMTLMDGVEAMYDVCEEWDFAEITNLDDEPTLNDVKRWIKEKTLIPIDEG